MTNCEIELTRKKRYNKSDKGANNSVVRNFLQNGRRLDIKEKVRRKSTGKCECGWNKCGTGRIGKNYLKNRGHL